MAGVSIFLLGRAVSAHRPIATRYAEPGSGGAISERAASVRRSVGGRGARDAARAQRRRAAISRLPDGPFGEGGRQYLPRGAPRHCVGAAIVFRLKGGGRSFWAGYAIGARRSIRPETGPVIANGRRYMYRGLKNTGRRGYRRRTVNTHMTCPRIGRVRQIGPRPPGRREQTSAPPTHPSRRVAALGQGHTRAELPPRANCLLARG